MNAMLSVPNQPMTPAASWRPAPNWEAINPPRRHHSATLRGTEGKPLILVVDDNPDMTSMFALILEQAGYDVILASSAPAALEAAERKRFDLIVSDIGMPEMDGYELARKLRALPGYLATPMIAVTGFTKFTVPESAFDSGFNAFLKKPVEPAKLLEIVARLGS